MGREASIHYIATSVPIPRLACLNVVIIRGITFVLVDNPLYNYISVNLAHYVIFIILT